MPCTGPAPLVANFTAAPGGGRPPYTYVWTFGDGGTSAEQNPAYTYTTEGEYTATCTITDLCGTQKLESTIVTVTPPSPPPPPVLCATCNPIEIPGRIYVRITGTWADGFTFACDYDGANWVGSQLSDLAPPGYCGVKIVIGCSGFPTFMALAGGGDWCDGTFTTMFDGPGSLTATVTTCSPFALTTGATFVSVASATLEFSDTPF